MPRVCPPPPSLQISLFAPLQREGGGERPGFPFCFWFIYVGKSMEMRAPRNLLVILLLGEDNIQNRPCTNLAIILIDKSLLSPALQNPTSLHPPVHMQPPPMAGLALHVLSLLPPRASFPSADGCGSGRGESVQLKCAADECVISPPPCALSSARHGARGGGLGLLQGQGTSKDGCDDYFFARR